MATNPTNTYSRYVSLMKIILPVGILLSIGLAIGWPYLMSAGKENLTMIDSSHPEIKENRMIRPHYVSTDGKGQPFQVTADWAKQKTENHADLIHPQGSMTMTEGETFNVKAKKGHYDSQGKVLTLNEDVILTNTNGDVIETEEAQVDIDNGTIQGKHSIKGKGAIGEFMGDGFKVEKRPQGKKVLTLTGHSRVVINPSSQKKKKKSHAQ